MKNRERIRVKAPSQSAAPPIQVKSLQFRPFAPTPNPATQQQVAPSIQAQLDGARRFGYDLSNISVFPTTSAAVQPKLTIGQPGDKYEQEANQVATDVVNRMNASASQTGQEMVQREENLDEANKLEMKLMVQSHPGNEKDKMLSKEDMSEDTKAPTSTPVARVGLHTDVESLTRIAPTLLELLGHRLPGREGGVGHSWISLQYNPQSQVPDNLPILPESLNKLKNREAVNFGFYPSDNENNKKMAIRSVQGSVQESDDFHTAKASKYYDVGQEQINAILNYVESQRNARYNIYNFQCTHFALGALRSAGISVPNAQGVVGGKTFVLPNGLYKDLAEMAFKPDPKDQDIPLREDSVELQYGPDVSEIGITKSTISILEDAVKSYFNQKGVMTENQEEIFKYLNQDIGNKKLVNERKKALKKLGFETGVTWFDNLLKLVGGFKNLDTENSKSIESRFRQVEATKLKIGQKMQLMTALVKYDANKYASMKRHKNQ